ncbi:MAG TPA: non-ribosomal peptide synthetase [Bacillota bacterium]|nr:non-ribosomal peptide synthetase [Bacillota bacterium]
MSENILRDSTFTKERDYWLAKLAGEITKSNFPYDYLQSNTNPPKWESISFTLPEKVAAAFIKMSNDSDIKLHMIILASITALLYKFTGNDDLIVGTPIYRQQVEGEFVNTMLAIRNQVAAGASFKELIIELRKTVIEAVEHQNYSLMKLIYLLNIPTVEDEFPLFDTVVWLQNIQERGYINPVYGNTLFSFIRDGQRIDGALEYNAHVYKRATVERIITQLLNLLEKVTGNLDTPLDQVELISEAERFQILNEFNNTAVPYPQDKTIAELFEEQVVLHPDKPAVQFTYLRDTNKEVKVDNYETQSLTYAELNRKSNQLARVLLAKGVKGDDLVGVLVERSLEMVIGILGILKAGGAYLPLDPEYPEARIKYMIEDSGVKIVLTQRRLMTSNITVNGALIVMDDDQAAIFQGDDSNLSRRSAPENLAYAIYTSGSTGQPKGVAIEHHGVANLKIFFEQRMGVSESDRIIQFAPFSFDAAVWEVFMSLLSGATLFLVAKEIINDSFKFEDFINQNQITIATLPPPFLASLNPERIHSLQKVIAAGSVSTTQLLNQWNSRVTYFDAYGPTETTVCATAWKAGTETIYEKSVPIGKPITNTQVYIVDKNLKLQPIGLIGEICVAGAGLARNYLNKPELTAARFVENPFTPGQKMYLTGDLGRWRPDGNIDFLGRMDNQVKVRGYRIEIGEIEFQLRQYPKLKEAIVTSISDEIGEMVIVAYFVAEQELSDQELKDYLLKSLPSYMIPSYFVQMDQLPLTLSGKIDRKALPKPQKHIKRNTAYIEPQNEAEIKIAGIWQSLLGVEKVGIGDSFFELGGDSLKATLLVGRIHKEMNSEISLMDIFKTPTLKEMALCLKSVENSAEELKEIEKLLTEIEELPEESV